MPSVTSLNGGNLYAVLKLYPIDFFLILSITVKVDFGEEKTAPTECQEKCFHMMSSAYLHYSKAPQNVLMTHLR